MSQFTGNQGQSYGNMQHNGSRNEPQTINNLPRDSHSKMGENQSPDYNGNYASPNTRQASHHGGVSSHGVHFTNNNQGQQGTIPDNMSQMSYDRNSNMQGRQSVNQYGQQQNGTNQSLGGNYRASNDQFSNDQAYDRNSVGGSVGKFNDNIDIRQDIREAFELLDTKRQGIVKGKELSVAMQAFGIEIPKPQMKVAMERSYTVEQLEAFMIPYILEQTYKDKEYERLFSILDIKKKNRITYEDIRHIAVKAGETAIPDEEIRALIKDNATTYSREQALDLNDFKQFMVRKD